MILLQELVAKRETLFFRDGKKRIDFVLAYRDGEDAHKKEKRDIFEKNIMEEGMEIEYEDKLVKSSFLTKMAN